MKGENYIKIKKGDFENLHFNVKVEVTGIPVEHDKWECEICQENMRELEDLLKPKD